MSESNHTPSAKEILDRYAGVVIDKESTYYKIIKDKKTGKEKIKYSVNSKNDQKIIYSESGYSDTYALWYAPYNCLRIEVDGVAKEQSDIWIAETEQNAKAMGFDYCITGHGGASDYLNIFNIEGIPTDDEENKEAKQILAEALLPKKAIPFLDLTNLGKTLTPIIGHPHWKEKKWNGNVHEIIRGKNPLEHKNKYPKDLLKPKKKEKEAPKPKSKVSSPDDKVKELIKEKITVTDLLKEFGIDTSKNPTMCPTGHDSVGQQCLHVTDDIVYYCHHCGSAGDIFNLYQDTVGVPFQQALKELAEKAGVELPKTKKKIINDLPIVELPGRVSNYYFANQLAKEIKGNEKIFYNPVTDSIVEIGEYYDGYLDKTFTGIITVKSVRFINIIDEMVNTVKINASKPYDPPQPKTMSEQLARYLLENTSFKQSLKKVSRILKSPIPFIVDNQCYIPHHGYNEKILAYLTEDSPKLTDKIKTIEDAKYIIEDLFKEFCFKEEIDRTMALSAFITPACRGLYKRPTARTPVYMYLANRPRAGKDFCAGLSGITYYDKNIEFPPIATTDFGKSDNVELQKKIVSVIIKGGRRYHSQNNKGKMDNGALEGTLTAEYIEDRILGKNETMELPNEIDFSISGNIGLQWTSDIWFRARPIHFFLDIENPNKRNFSRPNLHQHVRENRDIILSAIIFIIEKWVDAGSPSGKIFNSFPEWSRVVGGICEFVGWGDPTIAIESDDIGGDVEGRDFKTLVDCMVKIMNNTNQDSFLITEICDIVEQLNEDKDNDISFFTDLIDRDGKMGRGGRTSFGILFKKYNGRIFSGYRITVASNNKRASRIKYTFSKI